MVFVCTSCIAEQTDVRDAKSAAEIEFSIDPLRCSLMRLLDASPRPNPKSNQRGRILLVDSTKCKSEEMKPRLSSAALAPGTFFEKASYLRLRDFYNRHSGALRPVR